MNFYWDFTEVFSKGPINNFPVLAQIMAWRRSGDKLFSEPMVASSLIEYDNHILYLYFVLFIKGVLCIILLLTVFYIDPT